MKRVPLGRSELQSTRLIYGCMRISGTWQRDQVNEQRRREAFAALEAAVEAGYNHFDHADIYAHGVCEELFGEFLRANGRLRDELIITTKCGIRFAGDTGPDVPQRYDFSADWIERSCEGSLRRLGVDTIDVYLLHRPDVLMDPDEIAGVFERLRRSGKVRHFGVSNFTNAQLAALQSRLNEPLICNQIELHPLHIAPLEDGTINFLQQHRVTPTAWSPVAGGKLGDEATPQTAYPTQGEAADDGLRQRREHLRSVLAALDHEAAAYGVTRSIMVHAWLLRHPSGVLPIVGTRRPERIRALAQADELDLSRDAWYRIHVAARGAALP